MKNQLDLNLNEKIFNNYLNEKIKLYADGLNPSDFGKDLGVDIDGYTFNPSLFKKTELKIIWIIQRKF